MLILKIPNYVFSLLFAILPNTRLYGLKRLLLRWRGFAIGDNVRIISNVKIHVPKLSIDDNTFVGHDALFIGGNASISIGKNVDIAPRLLIATGSHQIGPMNQRAGNGYSSNVVIGDGTWIVANCTILGGVTIGKGCIIAAGTLVKDSAPNNCLIAGVPGRTKKNLTKDPIINHQLHE